MGVLNRAERLQIMLKPAELKLVDNWRFLKRIRAAHQRCENYSSVDWWPRVSKWRMMALTQKISA